MKSGGRDQQRLCARGGERSMGSLRNADECPYVSVSILCARAIITDESKHGAEMEEAF